MKKEELLVNGLKILKIPFTDRQLNLLKNFLKELNHWNKIYGFVKASQNELVIRHLLDSLSGLEIIRSLPHDSVIDVGSGAGFPGIPLAVFLENTDFTLLERSAKRAAFLRNAVILLGLKHVRVLEDELERIEDRFNIATFRAFAPLHKQIMQLKRILIPRGYIASFKGRLDSVDKEISKLTEITEAKVSVVPLKVPFLEEERCLVLIRI